MSSNKQSNEVAFLTIINAAECLYETVRKDRRDVSKLVLTLLGANIEYAQSCLLLLQAGKFSSGVPLVRCMTEVYVDIKLLCETNNHIELMKADYYHRVANIQRNKNAKAKQCKILRDESYEKYVGGKAEYPKEVSIRSKFDSAGVKNEFDDIYIKLCGFTHSGIQSLLNKYCIDEELVLAEMPLNKSKPSTSEYEAYRLANLYLLVSAELVAREHSKESLVIIQRLSKQMNEVYF